MKEEREKVKKGRHMPWQVYIHCSRVISDLLVVYKTSFVSPLSAQWTLIGRCPPWKDSKSCRLSIPATQKASMHIYPA